MFNRYKDLVEAKTFLESDRHGQPADQKLQVAVAALLWEMAKIDGEMNRQELQEMIVNIEHEFHIMDDEASQIVAVAEFLMSERRRSEEFLQVVNERFDDSQRQHFHELLMRVANADGFIDSREESHGTEMREKLNLAA